MKKAKFISFLVVAIFAFSLAACSGKKAEEKTQDPAKQEQAPQQAPENDTATPNGDSLFHDKDAVGQVVVLSQSQFA